MQRVLIAGSRNWDDVDKVEAVLRHLSEDTVVVHRGREGAEAIAARVADQAGQVVELVSTDGVPFVRRRELECDTIALNGVCQLIVFRNPGISLDIDRLIWLATKAGIDVVVHESHRRNIVRLNRVRTVRS